MKRFLSIILILVMLLVCVGAVAESYVESTGGDTYLRSYPSLGGKILSILHAGETASYLGQTSADERGVNWYKVLLNGTSGWVSEKYTKLHAETKYVTATGGDSNVRSTPSLSGYSLGTLRRNETALYLGDTSTDERGVAWYRISFKGGSGWVSSRYTTLDGTPQPAPVRYVNITGSTVNVRSDPSLSGKDIGTVKQGASLQYLNETRTDERGVAWYKVSFKGTTGWVSSKYSRLDGSAPQPAVTRYIKITGSKVNVRAEASLSGKDLGTVKQGASLQYLNEIRTDERGVDWYKVSFNGMTGWVSSKYSEFADNPSGGRSVKATGGDSNVRSTPSLSGKSLGTLKEGQSAAYLEERSMDERGVYWYKISFKGQTGWVSEKYTSIK